MVECATDNRNRTASEVRSAFTKRGGNMAEPGAVAFQFEQKGVIVVTAEDTDEAMLVAIDAGAQDIEEEGNTLTIYTNPKALNDVKQQLEDAGIKTDLAELRMEPKQEVPVSDEDTARKVLNLVEALEDLDDVANTYSNFDIPAEVLEKVG